MGYVRNLIFTWLDPVEPVRRDWKDPNEYEFIKSCRPSDIAWEFLRRNNDYVADYCEWAELRRRAEALSVGQKTEGTLDTRTLLQEADDLCDQLCDKYGLSRDMGLCHPNKGVPLFSCENVAVAEPLGFDGQHLVSLDEDAIGTMDVRIVLDRPIEPQLEQIRQWYDDHKAALLRQQRNSVEHKWARLQPNIYPTYLRILDAVSAGVSIPEIAKNLYPNSSIPDFDLRKVHQQKQRATAIMNVEYKGIAALALTK